MSKIVWTVVNKSKHDWKREYKVFSDESFIEFFESYFLGPENGPIEVTESMMRDFLRYIHKHEDDFFDEDEYDEMESFAFAALHSLKWHSWSLYVNYEN